MKETTRNKLATLYLTVFGTAITMAVMENSVYNNANRALGKRLDYKIERIADTNNDGTLSVEEMSDVYLTIEEDPAERLNSTGFNLSIEESQEYLKAKGKFEQKDDQITTKLFHYLF